MGTIDMDPMSTGYVVWITGVSGAGKSTVAAQLCTMLRAGGEVVVHLDGDEVRRILGNDLGYDPDARLANAYRIARLTHYLSSQGINVVCSTMSLFPEIWQWNRKHNRRYLEVYLRVSPDTVRRRDPKGHYSRFNAGDESNVVGADIPLIEPPDAHVVLENDHAVIQDQVTRIVAAIKENLS